MSQSEVHMRRLKDKEVDILIQTQEEIVKDSFFSKTYYTELNILNALKELKAYRNTGITPENLLEIDYLYTEKCKEVERLKSKDWIPCSKQLPGNNEEIVLVQVSGKPRENIVLEDALQLAMYCQDDGWVIEMFPEWNDAHPVVWQPLPETYTKEKQNYDAENH